jgi:hypothetical protein
MQSSGVETGIRLEPDKPNAPELLVSSTRVLRDLELSLLSILVKSLGSLTQKSYSIFRLDSGVIYRVLAITATIGWLLSLWRYGPLGRLTIVLLCVSILIWITVVISARKLYRIPIVARLENWLMRFFGWDIGPYS